MLVNRSVLQTGDAATPHLMFADQNVQAMDDVRRSHLTSADDVCRLRMMLVGHIRRIRIMCRQQKIVEAHDQS